MSSIEWNGIDYPDDCILTKKLQQLDGGKVTFHQKFPEVKEMLDLLVSKGKTNLPILRILWEYDKYQKGNFIYISSDKKNCILHPMAFAVRQGSEQLIELLMQTNIDFNAMDDCGLTLIHHAAYDSTGNSIKLVLKYSLDCNIQDAKGNTVLHHACRNGNFKVVELLSLSTNDIDLNIKDNNGTTALHVACIRGYFDMVKHFITNYRKLNIKLNVTDNQGFTPFHHACHQGYKSNLSIVQLILDHSNQFLIDAPNNLGMTPFHLACFYGQKHIIEYILLHSDKIPININGFTNDNDQKSAFHLACMRGHLSIVELFVDFSRKKKVVLNGRNSRGETPFFNACFKGHTNIVSFLLKHARKSIKLNIPDCSGVTPLHIACRQGFEDIVELLLMENPLDEEDTNGETALHHACIEGHLEVVKLLLKSGFNVNAPNHALAKPLHLACYYGHSEVVKTLLSHPNIDKNAKLPNGATMCHVACASGECEVVKLIMDFGYFEEAIDDFGSNACHYACCFNSSAELIILCFEAFKHNKQVLHATDNNGRTPIQLLLLQSSCQVILNELKEHISDPSIQIDIDRYQLKENLIRKRECYIQSTAKSCKKWFHKQF